MQSNFTDDWENPCYLTGQTNFSTSTYAKASPPKKKKQQQHNNNKKQTHKSRF